MLLQGFVVRSLQDSKVEVRNIAAATLSGMIKGMPASEAAQLRSDLLSQATSSFGAVGGRRRRAHGSSKASTEDVPLVKQLACIQGLKAFVMSTPYDCPAWMPGVLMALVAAAGAKAPQVRSHRGLWSCLVRSNVVLLWLLPRTLWQFSPLACDVCG